MVQCFPILQSAHNVKKINSADNNGDCNGRCEQTIIHSNGPGWDLMPPIVLVMSSPCHGLGSIQCQYTMNEENSL